MSKASEERRKDLERIRKQTKYKNFILIPMCIIPFAFILFIVIRVILSKKFEEDFLFSILSVFILSPLLLILLISNFKWQKKYIEVMRKTLEDKNGWLEDENFYERDKVSFFFAKITLIYGFVVSIIGMVRGYFKTVVGIFLMITAFSSTLLITTLFENYLMKNVKKFWDYHTKSLINVDYLQVISTLEKLFSDNKIGYKKLGGRKTFLEKYDELFSLENGFNIYIQNVPKQSVSEKHTNISLGKITPSNQSLAETIKSILDKLEE